jgi:hypothetical protein
MKPHYMTLGRRVLATPGYSLTSVESLGRVFHGGGCAGSGPNLHTVVAEVVNSAMLGKRSVTLRATLARFRTKSEGQRVAADLL